MDKLLNYAKQLAEQKIATLKAPIAKRIAYVVSHGQSYANNGYAIRTQGIAKALNDHGFETLCFVRPGRPWEFGAEQTVAPVSDIDGVRYIHSRWEKGISPQGEEKRLKASVDKFVELFNVFRPSVVLAGSNFIIGLPAYVAAKQLGIPFYNEVRGFWELSRAAREPGFELTESFKQEAARDAFVAKQAQRVFTLNQPMKQELVKRGVEEAKIQIIANGVNKLPIIHPINEHLKRKLDIRSEDKVVGYVGSFNAYEGLDVLVTACQTLINEGVHVKLLLVGDDGVSEKLRGCTGEHSYPWLITTGRIPHEQVADYYALIDVVVIPRKKLPVCEIVPPMKVAEALAYGKRLVVSDVAPLVEYAQKYNGVVSFEAGKAESLAQALHKALKLPAPKDTTVVLLQTRAMVKVLREGELESETIFQADSFAKSENPIDLANEFVEKHTSPLAEPIPRRIAIVASHGRNGSQNGYNKRTHRLATALKATGYAPICFIRPTEGHTHTIDQLLSRVEGISYIHSIWPSGTTPMSAAAHLNASVELYIDFFRKYRPEAVIAAGDFTSALPAIIAAISFDLPIFKEHLYYGDAFLDEESLTYFSSMDFSEKFALEQRCFTLANSSYYLLPDRPKSFDALLETLHQVTQKTPRHEPVAKLPPTGIHKVEHIIDGSGLHYLELDVDDESDGNSKGIVASFSIFDAKGKRLKDNLPGFSSSKAYSHYQYIDTSKANGTARVAVFSVPEGTSRIEVDVVAFATAGALTLRKANLGRIKIADVAAWLTIGMPGAHWIKAVEAYVHQEGATSLRLALLNYKHKLSQHPNDLSQLNGAIQELVELDRCWLPALAYSSKTVSVKQTDKLTVAHLHKTAYPYENTGGAIRCLNTALSQQRINIDPYIITPVGYPRSVGVLDAKNHEVIEGIEHFRIGANTDGLRGISLSDRTSYSAFHIAKFIKSRGANVIHAASGVRGYELALQALALKKITGLPLLYEVRSFHEHTWTPVRSDVMDLEKTKLRVIKEDFCMAQADFVTTISYGMKNILIERGVAPSKIEVIPNAIDEAKYLGKTFKPMHIPELKGADFVVGYISNMSRREGHQYLIRAIQQLRQLSGLDIRGLLVGDGPEYDNLQRLSNELGLEKVICFPGEIDHSQINSYYKAIDFFVIPRIPDYAADWVTPLKPYEAMALERPIIVTDLPALKEIVGENEERGLIAKPADVESLVEKLQSYINNPVMRQNKVSTAKKWVFAERTWSANAKRYEAIYRRLIAESSTVKEAMYA